MLFSYRWNALAREHIKRGDKRGTQLSFINDAVYISVLSGIERGEVLLRELFGGVLLHINGNLHLLGSHDERRGLDIYGRDNSVRFLFELNSDDVLTQNFKVKLVNTHADESAIVSGGEPARCIEVFKSAAVREGYYGKRERVAETHKLSDFFS